MAPVMGTSGGLGVAVGRLRAAEARAGSGPARNGFRGGRPPRRATPSSGAARHAWALFREIEFYSAAQLGLAVIAPDPADAQTQLGSFEINAVRMR
jgi:hypothetical protein